MLPCRWHDIEQNTPEWLELRLGKVTSSGLNHIMANYGKAFGDPAKNLAAEIALERLTGKKAKDSFTSYHMRQGHEHEPFARRAYEDETFNTVTNGGFFENGKEGDSPDALVNDDGILEIKSVTTAVHLATLRKGTYDSKYKWQLVQHLRCSKRLWVDYVSYGIHFPEGSNLFICRVHKDDLKEEFKMVDIRLKEFEKLVEENIEVLVKHYPDLSLNQTNVSTLTVSSNTVPSTSQNDEDKGNKVVSFYF